MIIIKKKIPIFASFLAITLITSGLASQIHSIDASSKSPYESGYDHGCDDADISDPDDRYINQPEKGPSFHTNEFMRGYNDGYDECSGGDSDDGNDNSGSSGIESSRLVHVGLRSSVASSIFLCTLSSMWLMDVVFAAVVMVVVVLWMNLQFYYISILTTHSNCQIRSFWM